MGEDFDSAPFEIKKNGKAPEFKNQGTGKYNEKFELEEDELDDMSMRQSILIAAKPKAAVVKYEDFTLKMLLGKGTFGKVYLAELPNKSDLYAIKVIRKDVLVEYNQV